MNLLQNAGEENFEELLACNRFIHDIQLEIETALAAKQVSYSELARRLDVSPARVSQILGGNGANLTARTIARIAFVLDVRACLSLSDHVEDAWVYGLVDAEPAAPEVLKYLGEPDELAPSSLFEATACNDAAAAPTRARSAA